MVSMKIEISIPHGLHWRPAEQALDRMGRPLNQSSWGRNPDGAFARELC
jgi:phosphotransferase system HPr-like phosphotransfer protein